MAHKHAHHGDGCVHTSGALTPTPGAEVGTGDGNGSVARGTDATRSGVAGTHHSDTEGPPTRRSIAKQCGTVQVAVAGLCAGERPSGGKHEEQDSEPADAPPRSTTPAQGDNDPTSEAARLADLAASMAAQGDFAGAENLMREALAKLRSVHGDGDVEAVMGLYLWAMALDSRGDYALAKPVLRESLAIARRVCYDSHHLVVANIVSALARAVRISDGPSSEVVDLFREQVAILRRLHDGMEHSDVVAGLLVLGRILQDFGDCVAAEVPLREAVAMARCVHKAAVDGHSDIVAGLIGLGKLMYARDEPSHGEPYLREALSMAHRMHGGRDHSDVADVLSLLGATMHAMGDSSAESLLREAVAMRGRLSDDGCCTATALGRLGRVLQESGDLAGAELHLRKAVAMERALHGDMAAGHAADLMLVLATVLKARGKLADAAVVLRDLQPLLLCHYGHHHGQSEQRVCANHLLGVVLREQGDLPGAERALRQALDLEFRLRGGVTRVSSVQTDIAVNLSSVLIEQGRLAAAERVPRELLVRLRREHGGKDNWLVAIALVKLAQVVLARRDVAGARPLLFEALAMMRRLPADTPFEHRSAHLAEVLETLSTVLQASGDHAGAAALLREVLTTRRRVHGDQDHSDVVTGLVRLGECLRGQRDLPGALTALREAEAMARRLYKGQDNRQLALTSGHLGAALSDSGDARAALPLHRKELAMLRRLYGRHDHRDVAASLFTLGVVMVWTGDVSGAEHRLRESADMWRRMRGQPGRDREQDDAETMAALRALAHVLHAKGDYKKLGVVMGKLVAISKASRAPSGHQQQRGASAGTPRKVESGSG